MSSINPHYTFQYSQPEEYRFSHDSVFLARRVFELVREDMQSNWSVLDLCAGCGIVGMDLLFHCRKELQKLPGRCDFLEVQHEYLSHFGLNKERLGMPDIEINFLNQNYNAPLATQYNLILCNPPYFSPDAGKLSPNNFKNRCRFFIDGTDTELIEAISSALLPGGRAYVLSRNKNLPASSGLHASPAGDIRGTPLICFEKI